MSKTAIFGLALATCAFLIATQPDGSTASQSGAVRTTWEYEKLSESTLEKRGGLNKLGAEGWELVTIEQKIPKLGGFNINMTSLRVDKNSGMGSGGGMANGLQFTYEPTENQYHFKRAK